MESSFFITDEQQAILDLVSRFAREEIEPRVALLDSNAQPEDCFSWELVELSDHLGIRTMTLPSEWGGMGIDSLTTAMVIEEIAKADIGMSVILAQTLKIAQIMDKALNERQREAVFSQFSKNPRGLLAIGITEPGNGSNYFLSQPVPFHTAASKVDGGWVVNGMKHFISNGNRASHYLVFAQTDRSKSMVEGSTCFLLGRDNPGLHIGRVHNKMGERLANNAELIFEDCFVADADVVGDVGRGFQVLSDFFPQSNAYAGASVLGTAVSLYEKSVEWAKTRIQGGQALIRHDGIRATLGEMRMLLDASRSYIHRACWLADHQEHGWDRTLGVLPKAMASQAAWKIATWAMEIHGGYGYMKEMGLEKLVRDAAAFLHSDGVNRTLFLKAANFMYDIYI